MASFAISSAYFCAAGGGVKRRDKRCSSDAELNAIATRLVRQTRKVHFIHRGAARMFTKLWRNSCMLPYLERPALFPNLVCRSLARCFVDSLIIYNAS